MSMDLTRNTHQDIPGPHSIILCFNAINGILFSQLSFGVTVKSLDPLDLFGGHDLP